MKNLFIFFILFVTSMPCMAQIDNNIDEWGIKGKTAFERGDYQEASYYFELVKKGFDELNMRDEDYCSVLSILAACYYNMRLYHKAVDYGNNALELTDESSQLYNTLLNNLVLFYSELGDYSTAIEYETRALNIKKSKFGDNHPDYAESLHHLSILYSDIKDFPKAIEYANKAKAIYEVTIGENHAYFAILMDNFADYYSKLNDYSTAIEYASKSLEIKKSIFGEEHPDYAKSLSDLASFFHSIGQDEDAVEYELKAVNIIREVLGETYPDYVINIRVLGIYYSNLGDYSKAIEYETKALEITKSVLGEKHPDYIGSLSVLIHYYYCLGNFSKAIEYGTEEKDLIKETKGEDNSDFATSLNNLSCYYFALGNYLEAVELGEQTLKIRKATLGENHPDYAASLSNLSNSYAHLGNFSKAVEYEEHALVIYKVTQGESHPNFAKSLSNLSGYYSALGDYSKALKYGEQALESRKSILSENHPDYAISLNNIASICSKIGNYSKAVELEKQALGILKATFGEDHPEYASFLLNLGNSYFHLGDYLKAEELYNEVLEIFKFALGENHQKYADLLNNLAVLYSTFGDYSKAVELDSQAYEIRKAIFGEIHPDCAQSLNNLASDYACLGDYSKAVELGGQALDILKASFGENHPDVATSLSNLAGYYSYLGDHSKSIDFCSRAVTFFKSMNLHLFSSLSANQRTLNWTNYSYLFTDYYPNLFYKSNRHQAADIYDNAALFAKSLLLTTEMEINRLIQESGDQESLDILENLRSKRLLLQKLYETPISERYVNVDSIANEADLLEKTLVMRSKVYGDFEQRFKTTWKDIQNVLAVDEIAVEFLSFNLIGTDSTMVAALTLKKDDIEPNFIPLFELRQLLELVDTEYFICPELTDLVWKPLQNELHGIRRIYFSPAGVLHRIGIDYLPGMEEYEMFRLSTTREIIDMKEKTVSHQKDKTMAVLYGGVDYEASEVSDSDTSTQVIANVLSDDTSRQLSLSFHRAFIDSLDLRSMTAGYLPNTLTEVKNISAMLEKSKYPTVVHVGMKATETSVKSLSTKAPSILHISTHGFYYTEKQARKENRPRFLGIDEEQIINVEDKMLTRSGLLMAGANHSLKGEDVPMDVDDGILTALEISRLDLRGVDLVVLSACETGNGDIMQGEGVFGLQRAFKKAGAQTILMSLWKVADIPTEMLMTEFYKNLCEGKSKRESLRIAQKTVREYKDSDGNSLFQDPQYWAGFILLD